MNTSSGAQGGLDGDIFSRVVDAIHQQGYIVLDDFLSPATLQGLCQHYHSIEQARFRAAGVGREQAYQLNQQVRSDEIFWLDGKDPASAGYFDWLEQLRLRINQELFLGLFDYESHYAYYPVGAFYKRHVDAFKGSSNRRLSTVLYLNEQWQAEDGGELLMYEADEDKPFETIQPIYGRLVIFLSERFPHEVAITQRERFSLTGWFRINGSRSEQPDPPK